MSDDRDKKGSIRIISGKWRGTILKVQKGPDLRPTPNRARETLFNWLNNCITGARCLDAFAGTGALGFEAISRGAQEVVMIEQDFSAYNEICLKAKTLRATEQIRLYLGGFLSIVPLLKAENLLFDLVFLDPPFSMGRLDSCGSSKFFLQLTEVLDGLLTKEALVYWESEFLLPVVDGWYTVKSSRAGKVFYHLLHK